MARLKPLPIDFDLYVVPTKRTPQGDTLVSQFIAAEMKKPGYRKAVANLSRAAMQMQSRPAKRSRRTVRAAEAWRAILNEFAPEFQKRVKPEKFAVSVKLPVVQETH